MTIFPGKLASKINRLNSSALTEISSLERQSYEEYKKYIDKDNTALRCVNLKALRSANSFGLYTHPNKQIQEFIRNMLADLPTPLDRTVGQLSGGTTTYGFTVAELEFGIKNCQLFLRSVDILNRDYVGFRGRKGFIVDVTYVDRTKKYLPYWKVLHLTNEFATGEDDPFGVPEAKSALPFIKLKMAAYSTLSVAMGLYSTGIPIFKVNDGSKVTLRDELGNLKGKQVVEASQAYLEQWRNLENNKFVVMSKQDELQPFQVGDASQLWTTALPNIDNQIRNAFGIPQIIFENPTALTGAANFISKQTNILDISITTVVDQLKHQIITKAIKPILQENFKEYEEYGSFEVEDTADPTVELQKLGQLYTAISMGIFNPNDIDVQNKVRGILDIPKLTKDEQIKLIQEQTQLQMLQQQMMKPSIDSEDPDSQYP